MIANGFNYLFFKWETVNYVFERDWTISFALYFPAIDKDIPWPGLFLKGGNSHCFTHFCGPYICKHPDSYGIHTVIATDFSTYEKFDTPPVQIRLWTQVTFVYKQKTVSIYFDESLVARKDL